MDKIVETGTMGGVRYEIHCVSRFLHSPLYYAILKFTADEQIQTDSVKYKSECMDYIRTVIAEEHIYG